jgi:hypothetical protein
MRCRAARRAARVQAPRDFKLGSPSHSNGRTVTRMASWGARAAHEVVLHVFVHFRLEAGAATRPRRIQSRFYNNLALEGLAFKLPRPRSCTPGPRRPSHHT